MKLIEQLIKVTPDKTIKLLKLFIEKNKYCTISELRQIDHRNLYYVKKDIKIFLDLGWIISKEEASLIGKNKVPIFYTKYKIDNEHTAIKMLNAEINTGEEKWEI